MKFKILFIGRVKAIKTNTEFFHLFILLPSHLSYSLRLLIQTPTQTPQLFFFAQNPGLKTLIHFLISYIDLTLFQILLL